MGITLAVDFCVFTCGRCGGAYALSERYVREKREYGGIWNCPYCENSWGYLKNGSQITKLKHKLDQSEGLAARNKSRAEYEERRARAYKGHLTRTKKRVGKGVCPCCNRYFKNLEKHMVGQHPEYAKEQA